MPTQEAADLIELVRDVADRELRPLGAEEEASEAFPRKLFTLLGGVGILGPPYGEEYGGGGQAYEVYLQVLEELAAAWSSEAVGVSVHVLSCFALVSQGTEEQKRAWLPAMLEGGLLGAY
jgi:alkylation response protein AidB-like acyl-CoA dehydrogenase